MKTRKIAYLTATLLAAAGCSVINAPEDLIAVDDGGDGDGDGDGDTGGTQGDGDMGGSSGDGDGDTGGTQGDGDGDMPVPEPPTSGLIVVAGQDLTADERVLLTLNATNGTEIDREALRAVTLAYDEAPDRLFWFIFTSARVDPGANTLAGLEVRYFFDETQTWTTVSSASALPPPLLRGDQGANPGPSPTAAFRPVVLNDRLVYVSQIVDGGSPRPAITILDTTDPNDVVVQESITVPDGEAIMGLVGRRGTELNPDATGGSVSIMVRRNCAGANQPCDLVARPVTISGNVSELSPDNFGQFQGIPAFATTPVLDDSVSRPFKNVIDSLGGYALSFDPNTNDPRWWQFDPADPASKAAPRTLGSASSTSFTGFAISECLAAGVSSDAMTGSLSGVHLANASVLPLATMDDIVAQDIQVEPFRRNVIAMRPSGSAWPSVLAFQIETIGSGASEQVALARRLTWSAPDDVDPISFTIRRPTSSACD